MKKEMRRTEELERVQKDMADAGISSKDFEFALARPERPSLKHGRAIDALERMMEGERAETLRAEREKVRDAARARAGEIQAASAAIVRAEREELAKRQQRWSPAFQ